MVPNVKNIRVAYEHLSKDHLMWKDDYAATRMHDGGGAALSDDGIVPAEVELETNYYDSIHLSLVDHNIHHNVQT